MTSHDAPGTAIVTGASSGIGWEYATRLAARGWGLVLVARRAERLDVLAKDALKEGAAGVETLVADLGNPEDLSRVVERSSGDDVDLVVNNAGINGYGMFAEVDPDLLTRVVNVNVVALTALTGPPCPACWRAAGGRDQRGVAPRLRRRPPAGPAPPAGRLRRDQGVRGDVHPHPGRRAGRDSGTGAGRVPGLTATEFHLGAGDTPVSGERRVHDDGGMPAADVVTASLAGLDAGEVVCVPGLTDAEAVARLAGAELDLRAGSGRRMAPRYGNAEGRAE